MHNPARASMPVNMGSSYTSVYGADPHASQPIVGARYDDPITPRTQSTIDYRNAPAVPTPPQLHKTQQPPVATTAASTSVASQPALTSHHLQQHHHQHAPSDPSPHHLHQHHPQHQHQHQPSMPPPATTTIRSHAAGKDPITRSTSLRDPIRTHRTSFSESTPKRPIIITTTTGGSSAAASTSTLAARGPPSPTRADHFRPPSAEPIRGPSMRDDNYHYSMPAASAALRSRGARYSYSGLPMSATLDNDELFRLRGRHEALHSAPRVDSFPRSRPMSAYVNPPRHSSASIPGPGAAGSITSGAGSTSLSSTLVGSAAGSGPNSYGDQGYEYTKPSDLARYDITYEQAGPRRGRRDSFDRNYYRPTVNLATELGRPYGYESGLRRPAGGSSAAGGSGGPPPTTWGLDKINRNAPAGSHASSAPVPVGYDPVTSIRAPVVHTTTVPIEHTHRPPEHGAGSFASSAALGSSSTRASSRHRPSGRYPPDDYYRGRDDEIMRDRRGGDRVRDYRGRDYRDRDYRESDRDLVHKKEGPRDRSRGDGIRDGERGREGARGPREYYADGTTANRAFGILVNSRDHRLRQEQPSTGTIAIADRPYYDEQRSTYAEDGLRKDREEPRADYKSGRYGGIDRDFVRGRPEPTERLGIESPKRKETEDDMYVHHPQEGMRQWDHSDHHDYEDGDYEYERDGGRALREPRAFHDLHDSRNPRDTQDSRRERAHESNRERETLSQDLDPNPERERERERERNRERERERAKDREREKERERERQRAQDRDRTHERGHEQDWDHDRDRDYDTRLSRLAGDEELLNTKKSSRDKASTGLGVAAATAAAVTASSIANESGSRPSTKDSREPSRRGRDRNLDRDLDRSPHSPDSRSRETRHRLSDYDDDRGSEASYDSGTSGYTTPAPGLASTPVIADVDAKGRARTYPIDRTPSTSEDGDSDNEIKEPSTRKKRQHTTATSFVPTNTEDLKAIKAELAAMEAKETSEGISSKKDKETTGKASRVVDDISPSRGETVNKAGKADKARAPSPSTLTPSSTIPSEASSPNIRAGGELDSTNTSNTSGVGAADGAVSAAATAASSKGKGKESEVQRDSTPEHSPERAPGSTSEITPEADEQSDKRRGRDQSQQPSKGLVVRLVSPPREKEEKRPVKSILKTPKARFPEEANPIREGVAPHKDDKAKQQGVPPGARWTRISRKLVNPEALTIGKERFEVRDDFVIVLRVLSREEIEAYTIATAQIRGKDTFC